MESTVEIKMKEAMVDENEGLELDPLIWQELPKELLERVLTKLPFSRVVAFRTVSKRWHLDIIPHVAPNVEASSKSVLLYFGFLCHYEARPKGWKNEESKGSPWWLQVGKSESELTGPVQEFDQKSFPSPNNAEEVRLMACEQGLLFFGIIEKVDQVVRDIFVCNPLTSQFKSLGLPRPLRPPCKDDEWTDAGVLVGMVLGSRTRSYGLVIAGKDGTGEYVTFLYESLTSAWTTGSSLLPAILEVGEGLMDLRTGTSRSVYWNGNLYWYALTLLGQVDERKYVVKFDIQQGTWRLIPDLVVVCSDFSSLGACQMALYRGEIMLWHLHRLLYEEYHEYQDDWPCRSHLKLELAPEIKLMQRHMIERVEEFLHIPTRVQRSDLRLDDFEYLAFSQQNFIYHVLMLASRADGTYDQWLKIAVQDTNENTFTELPIVPEQRFPYHAFSPLNVWSYSASLTSMP